VNRDLHGPIELNPAVGSPATDMAELDGIPPFARGATARPLIYHAGLYAASAALLKLAGFVFFLWLARTLSVNDYATWGLLYALQTGVASFGLVGIVEAVVGLLKTHRSAEDQRRLFAAANGVFLFTSVFSILFATTIYVAFLGRAGTFLVATTGVVASGALLAYSSLQAQIVRLEERHLASLCFNFLIPLCGFAGSLASFVLLRTVQSFFWGSAIGLGVALLGAKLRDVGFYAIAARVVELRPILLRVTPFIAVTFLGWLGGYGNNYVVKLFFSSAEVAKFTLVFMLSATMQLIATSMNQVWSPRFYRMIHHLPFEQVERENRRFFRLQGLVLGLAGGLLIALYPSAVKVLGGNLTHYRSVGFELFLLVSSYVVVIPYWHCQNYLLAFDKGQTMMRLHTVTSVIGIVVLVIFMWLLGPLGIYIGFLVQMGLRSAGAVIVTRAQWPVTIGLDSVVAGTAITFIGFLVSGSGFGH
jgi:O-antigen/teichoic acid export membrane protein